MATPQTLRKGGTSQALADPYWGVSASRRWVLLERGHLRGHFGFGLAYREDADVLSATHWDFASQLGVRLRLPRAGPLWSSPSAIGLTLASNNRITGRIS